MNAPSTTTADELGGLRRASILMILFGVVLIVVGMVALGSAFVATLASVVVIGSALAVGGVAHVIAAITCRQWRGFAIHLLLGILFVVVGVLMIEKPLRAAADLTLLIAASLMVGGLLRVVFALTENFPGRFWVLLGGVVSTVLGVMIWRQWPESALWVIGTFVGIDMLMCGWTWVMLGLSARSAKV